MVTHESRPLGQPIDWSVTTTGSANARLPTDWSATNLQQYSLTSRHSILMRGHTAGVWGGFFMQLNNATLASWEQYSRLWQSYWCRYWFFCCERL